MTNERFLVTGAMGCIGAWVVRNLAREGRPVVFDLSNDPKRLKQIATPEELAQVKFIAGDITDLDAVERALDEHEITNVIHLAALQVPFCRANPPLGAQVNVVGTVNVFEAVARRKARINSVVYASSIAVYDAVEASGGLATEQTTAHPMSLYGVYKQANEGTARIYWQDNQVASIGLRPYTVYFVGRDQGMTSSPTKAMFAAAVGQPYHISFGGRGIFQYAEDVANAFIIAARTRFEGAELFNLGGSVVTMSEVVAAIQAAAPQSVGSITFAETQLSLPADVDAAPVRQALGELPFTPLPEAVYETVNRFRTLVERGEMTQDAILS